MSSVFILGAGASRESGGPLMSDFLDVAERRRKEDRIDPKAFDLVFKGLAELQIAHSKATLDTNNIESVMVAFEMASLFGRLGGLSTDEVEGLPDAIATLIAQTVEESVVFSFRKGSLTPGVRTSAGYTAFAGLIREFVSCHQPLSILTFNYDLGADVALDNISLIPDYGLPDQDSLHPGAIPLLKLHGSLAWTATLAEKKIVPLKLQRLIRENHQSNDQAPFRVREHLQALGPGVTGTPVIVPPTFTKGALYKNIQSVWRRAAGLLSSAESIFVFGYSLPPSDEFFRLLFALGTVGTTRLKRFWVFDPDSSVEGRFRTLLGPAAMTRFEFKSSTFTHAVGELQTRLRKDGFLAMR